MAIIVTGKQTPHTLGAGVGERVNSVYVWMISLVATLISGLAAASETVGLESLDLRSLRRWDGTIGTPITTASRTNSCARGGGDGF